MDSIIIYDNSSLEKHYMSLKVFSDVSNTLPFPLNLSITWRWLISAFLAVVFIQGVRLRLKIISYIRSPDTKLNETNILFCLDQLNGLFLAIMLACGTSFVALTAPAAKLIGHNICYFNGAGQGLYISGTFTWRCSIALYRVLCIKAQMWLKGKIGMKNLLALMIGLGLVIMIGFSFVSVTFDRYSYSKRNCNHWSDEFLDVLQTYQAMTEVSQASEDRCEQCWLLYFSLGGLVLTAVEFCCYAIIFLHLKTHNSDLDLLELLDQDVIKKRNRINAVSLSGLFICWLLEVIHLLFAGFLRLIVGGHWNRVISLYTRYLEFVLVPLVHIHTSPPIRRYLSSLER